MLQCCLLMTLKIYLVVRNNDDALLLQNDLNKWISWTNIWQLLLNITKCKVLHTIIVKLHLKLEIWEYSLILNFNLPLTKFTWHYFQVSFMNLDVDSFPYLYKVLVHTVIEYGNII